MTELLLEPFRYEFMVRGMIAAVLVGFVCATVGTYVVLKGMAFYGTALAHTILPGVAVGYMVGGGERRHLFWWGMIAALASAISIGAISQKAKIKEDTAIGIIFAGMFALGIAIISTVRNYSVDLTHFLFGDILGVSNYDLVLIVVFSSVILFTVFLFYKEFLVVIFDPVLATTLRIPAKLIEYLLFILIAMAIVVSLQTVGIALMVAMLVTPSATAYLLAKRFSRMMAISILIAVVSGVLGLYISYYVQISSGAAIVLVATASFLVVWSVRMITAFVIRQAG